MKRRSILQALGLLGATGWAMSPGGILSPAFANVSQRSLRNARALVLDQIGYTKPTVMPQVISIFLYGGPSELGANLTNMDEINAVSQNLYPNNLMPSEDGGEVTPNLFWNSAGGAQMERMMKAGRLSVYRTFNRVIDDSKAHRPSIFSNLTGLVGEDDSRPGIASNLAVILGANNAVNEDALFPFVTMEGESPIFNQGDLSVPSRLKPLSLDRNLGNPYERDPVSFIEDTDDAELEAIVNSMLGNSESRYSKVVDAFKKRGEIATFVNELKDGIDADELPLDPDAVQPAPPEDPIRVSYPNNNQFSSKLRNAISLMVKNPETQFISMGSDGLGGWDDHNDALDQYENRMNALMSALEAAAKHIEAEGKDNIVIVVQGEFGRNANLNGSRGWDHGNNQNLYVVGASNNAGPGITGNELGKLVGKTKLIGTAANNRLYTSPSDDSYQCEPFALAATLYKYFGIENPEALTDGIMPIDETGTANEWVDPDAAT